MLHWPWNAALTVALLAAADLALFAWLMPREEGEAPKPVRPADEAPPAHDPAELTLRLAGR